MDKLKNILITGASGLIGKVLTKQLRTQGHRVVHLSRTGGKPGVFGWDVDKGFIDPAAFEGIDTIIHLAGAGVADKRWTPERKREILESRTRSTRLLFDFLKKEAHSVRHFISASAIGYYGFETTEKIYSEDDQPGSDYLAQVTKAWEHEVDQIENLGIRVVKIRVGIVLSVNGGALREMMNPIKMFAGAPLGTGKQWMSWIHIDDVCAMFAYAATHEELKGAYNGVAPEPATNATLTKAIGRALGKPVILPPVPLFVLKIMVGEMAVIVANGSRISSAKIEQAGFRFAHRDLDESLRHLIQNGQ